MTIPAGVLPSDVLISSPIVSGEGAVGAGGGGLGGAGGGDFGGVADFAGENCWLGYVRYEHMLKLFRIFILNFV